MVGFIGRATELRRLRAWARGSEHGIVHLVTGPGGSGKTRLAIEFAAQLQEEGWQCGFLQGNSSDRAIAVISASGIATLLVVEYAEAHTDLEVLLEALPAHSTDPVILVLLLAPTRGQWWQPDGPLRRHAPIRDVLADAEVMELSPIARSSQEIFNAALTAFADHYDIPAPATTLRPVAKGTPVLLLHTAALTAVLSAREGAGFPASVAATQDIVKELLGHENKYWSDTLAAHDLDQIGAGTDTRRQAVAIAGLLGADDEQQAGQVLRRLPVLADAPALTIQMILNWLREIYPADSSSWLSSIQPDLLLEYLVTSVFADSERLAKLALVSLPEDRARHALVVLARALDHYPAPATVLLRQLLGGHVELLAVAAVRLARNLDSPVVGRIIAAVLADTPTSHEVLSLLAADLRQVSVPLAPVAVIVHMQIAVTEITAGNVQATATAAATLTSITYQLDRQELPAAAENVGRAAVTLWQVVEEVEPGSHQADWIAPASLEAAMSANYLLSYQIPVPYNGFPRTLSAAYRRSMSEAYPRYTRIPSPSWRASHHRLPAIPS